MSSPNHQEWIERLLENNLDESRRAELIGALRADPELRRELSLHLGISDSLSRLKGERQDETFIRSTIGHVMSLGPENQDAFVGGITRRIVRRNWTRRLAIAAVLALAAAGSVLTYRHLHNPATVAYMIELNNSGQIIARHDISPGFQRTASAGLFRINFDNGAVVAIEGPADFKIESPMQMRLHSGKLNAWCPETAHGFKVVTATGTVTDLGTSFGVSIGKNGASDFLVLDGLIEVSQNGNTRRVEEGQAIRTVSTPGFTDLVFEPGPFRRTWPLASGILSTSGSVAPAPPGTAEQLSKLENNDSVLVIPEKRNVIFDQPITAELVGPGTFSPVNATQLHTLPPDPEKRLHSFLVRYNPTYELGFKRFDGEVTFDRPVLAICCQGKYLAATDPLFATGTWTDVDETARKFRGIDLDQPSGFPEEIHLSDDRKTVKITFNAGISSDDIRVILEEQ